MAKGSRPGRPRGSRAATAWTDDLKAAIALYGSILASTVIQMADDSKTMRAWEIYRHEDGMLAQRMAYGMVAQSMLVLSFITLFVYQHQVPQYSVALELVVGVLGFTYSFFQFTRSRSTSIRIRFLQNEYLFPNDPIFAAYIKAHNPKRRWIIDQYMIAVYFCCGWILLLGVAIFAARAN